MSCAAAAQASNTITVWNNGDGVPVEIHKEEKVYVPEMIFGHLLTSSNYNDNEKKVRLPRHAALLVQLLCRSSKHALHVFGKPERLTPTALSP